jgi:hypothetical protein
VPLQAGQVRGRTSFIWIAAVAMRGSSSHRIQGVPSGSFAICPQPSQVVQVVVKSWSGSRLGVMGCQALNIFAMAVACSSMAGVM